MTIKASNTVTITNVNDGKNGENVESITKYYLLSSSLSKPEKPDDKINPPGESWTTTEPDYSASDGTKILYTVEYTKLTDGTGFYSEVQKSSSYSAAIDAYNEVNILAKNSDDRFSQINVRIGEISSTVQENGEAISTLKQTAYGFETRVSNIERDIDVYMSFSSDGLILGRSDSDYKLSLTNSGIDFLFDDDAIGTITSVSGDPQSPFGGGDYTVITCGGASLLLSHTQDDYERQYFGIDGRPCFPPDRWKDENVNGTDCPFIPITLMKISDTSKKLEPYDRSIPTKTWVRNYAAKQGSEKGNIPSFYNVRLQELVDDRSGTSTPNVHVSAKGGLHTTTKSSRRWKHDITDFENVFDYEDLYKLPVRSFIYNLDKMSEDDPRYGVETPGFIAEEVHDTIPIAADMSEDGTQVDNWNDRIMIPYMVKAIQEQHKEIMNLETRLAELEAKLK